MSSLIGADALTERFRASGKLWFSLDEVLDEISDAPTIEAEPGRRGKWDKAQPHYPYTKESRKSFCSLCRNWGRKSFKYCPHCGAKMDSEVEND